MTCTEVVDFNLDTGFARQIQREIENAISFLQQDGLQQFKADLNAEGLYATRGFYDAFVVQSSRGQVALGVRPASGGSAKL